MIAVIGAMDIETDGLRALMHGVKDESVGLIRIATGTLGGKKAAVCRCGVGKVAAAAAAATLCARYRIDAMINIGVAGGVKPIRRGDVVVGVKAVQHDYSAVADGLPLGQVHGFDSPYFTLDEQIAAGLMRAGEGEQTSFSTGTIVSGDQFINDSRTVQLLHSTFGASAIDMETAAIAQVCAMLNVRFGALRSISDNGDEAAVGSFYEFVERASAISIRTVARYITEIYMP